MIQSSIRTIIEKILEDPEAIDFEVECTSVESDEEPAVAAVNIGHLNGFLIDKGFLPEQYGDWNIDVFDMRSSHAEEAYALLHTQRALIGKALPDSNLLELGSAFILLERAWIDPAHRGNGLALRLMREAKHVLGRYGLLALLKAHPDGEDVTTEHILRLANYYVSDGHLGFKHLSKTQFPGWLVAHWGAPEVAEGDSCYWHGQ
jgi:GNAT superfamily N-acetyltransferase